MKITSTLRNYINNSLNSLGLEEVKKENIVLEHPSDKSHGDYSTNVAMVLFRKLKNSKNDEEHSFNSPRELAQLIVDELKKDNGQVDSEFYSFVSKIEVAGPGFINFTLSDAFLIAKMGLIIEKRGDVIEKIGNGKNIVVEYSSPNIAKPFTVGHLRSTIIGDSLANIFEVSGYKVYRDNHLGDWGTQFGKQIYAIKTWGDEEQIENSSDPVKELVKLYVKFHKEADENPEIVDKGREWFTKLENGDEEARRLWKKCIDWSWKEFEIIYKKLGVNFTENNGRGFGESFFENKMDGIVQELETKNLLTESEGAKLIFFPEDKYPPLMIIKKDGSTLYSTRDLATDKFRLEQYGSDIKVFNEVGSEQSLYFKQLFEVEKMLGWYEEDQRVHIAHGLIRFKDKKMSTRKGNVIWLNDVLGEAYKRVENISVDLTSDAIWKIAIGALKWNDLKRKYHLPLVFDWDELTNIKGNSGPYIQYTYVRCHSVLMKAQNTVFSDLKPKENTVKNEQNMMDKTVNSGVSDKQESADIKRSIADRFDTLLDNKEYFEYRPNADEKDVLRNLYIYSDIIRSSAKEYAPHYISGYLYELAQSFNKFYGNNKVVDEANDKKTTEFRLMLVQAVSLVLKHGLNILGIETLEKM
jgi:arginyl-tRNA synthetase